MTKQRIGAKTRYFALVGVAALALTACGTGGTAAPSSTDAGTATTDASQAPAVAGVAFGATKEEWIKAFENIDPIQLYAQTPAPKGSPTGLNMENYFAAVEEWSGGKITFDIAYSNAVAPPAEIDDALNDGRLDIGSVLPIYEPSDYPATNALIEAGILNSPTAVAGVLQSNAWPNEVAFNTPEIMAEWDAHGLVPLVPIFNSGANGLFCSSEHSTKESMKGATVSAGGTIQVAQVEALGASATSIAYTELFESLQRGVAQCSVSSETVALLGGFLPEAPFVIVDPEATFAVAPGGLAFSKAKWETLPLEAKQLFWDQLPVFSGQNITVKIWPNTVEAQKTVEASGGAFGVFDEAGRQAIQQVNKDVLERLRGSEALDGQAMVALAEKASTGWLKKVEDLGYDSSVGYAEFAQWAEAGNDDISDYLDLVFADIFLPLRPAE